MNTPHKQAIRQSFDQAAAGYDAAAWLQQEVVRRLDERLDLMKIQPRSVLDAGCGTGMALETLQRRFPDATQYGLDLAPGMLAQARARHRPQAGWQGLAARLGLARGARPPLWLCADLEQLPLRSNSVDLLWSSLALQWVDDPEATLRGFQHCLRPDGLLIFSTFGPDTLKELRAAFQGVDTFEHVNQFIDMHDIGDMLMRAGFRNPVMEMEYLTLTYETLPQLLHELKAIGAHTIRQSRRTGLFGKAAWQRLQSQYEQFRRDGRLPATYEVIYGHAWVGPKDRLPDGRQVIQVEFPRSHRRMHGT